MNWRGAIAALLVALVLAVPAGALAVLNKLPTRLDPAKAYVVVEMGKLDDGLLYSSLVISRYDMMRGDIADPTPPPGGRIKGKWVQDNRVHLLKSFARDKERRLYLAELEPGLWVIEGANDTAFSLGSSTLQLEAGSITDLGVATVYSDFPEGEKREVMSAGRLMKGALMGGIFGSVTPPPMPKAVEFRPRIAADMPLPSILSATARLPVWSGEVRFGNHLGGLVNRMGGRKARPGYQAPPVELTAGPAP